MRYMVYNALVLGMTIVVLLAIAFSFAPEIMLPVAYNRTLSSGLVEDVAYRVRDVMWNVRGTDLVLQSVVIFATIVAVAALRRTRRSKTW